MGAYRLGGDELPFDDSLEWLEFLTPLPAAPLDLNGVLGLSDPPAPPLITAQPTPVVTCLGASARQLSAPRWRLGETRQWCLIGYVTGDKRLREGVCTRGSPGFISRVTAPPKDSSWRTSWGKPTPAKDPHP
jgi:hypothetical protein